MAQFTRESLIKKLQVICSSEQEERWHPNARPGNTGAAGHTLEDLLGIEENNLSLPDYGEFEIKTQNKKSQSLLTLFHEQPNDDPIVQELAKALGWEHEHAGMTVGNTTYASDEKSFRSTTTTKFSVRGFRIKIVNDRLEFEFDPNEVACEQKDRSHAARGTDRTYGDWLADVEQRTNPHYSDLPPVSYGVNDLISKAEKKLSQLCYVVYTSRERNQFFNYNEMYLLRGVKRDLFKNLLSLGTLKIDFDARSGHDHGVKLRIAPKGLPQLFSCSEKII